MERKYDTPEKIITILNMDENCNEYREFITEWNSKPQEREELHRNTLRYSVLKAYWDNPEAYSPVLDLFVSKKISIRRNKAPIYALDDEDVVEEKKDEFSILLNDLDLFNQHISPTNKSSNNPELTYEKYSENVKKATNLFIKHPTLWGKYNEGKLIYINYYHDFTENNIAIVKNGKELPYSSHDIKYMFRNISHSDKIESIEVLRKENPSYFRNIGKIDFRNYKTKLPKPRFNSSSNPREYFLVNNLLSQTLTDESYQLFHYLNENFDFNLSGAVYERDEAKNTKTDWKRSRYNIYKIESEKYQRTPFTRNENTSLLFEAFVNHLDSGEDTMSPHLSSYFDKVIKSGQFISLMEKNILTWSTSTKLEDYFYYDLGKYNFDSFLHEGRAIASDLLFIHKGMREFIYKNSEEILKHEKSNELRNKFVEMLVVNAQFTKIPVKLKDADNSQWINSKNEDENVVFVVDKNLKYISNDKKNHISEKLDKIVKLDKSETTKAERKSILLYLIKANKHEVLFNDKNIHTLFENINDVYPLMGKSFNPLESLILNEKIDTVIYYSQDEVKFENDKERIEPYKDKFNKILQFIFDKGIYKLPMANKVESRYGSEELNGNPLAQALFLGSIGSNYFLNAISEEQVKLLLQDDLLNYDTNNTQQIKKALYTNINKNVSLDNNGNAEINRQETIENIVNKLHNNNFDFSLPIETNEQAIAFIKMLTAIQNPELLTSLYTKYQSDIIKCYSLSPENNSEIMNSLQNPTLYTLLGKDIDFDKIELLFRNTNSEVTYKYFLEKNNIEIINKDRNILLEAIDNKLYSVAMAIIKHDPASIFISSKTNRLPLELALKDSISFSKRDGKYFSKEDEKKANEFITHVLETSVIENNVSKKAIANLSIAVDSSNLSEKGKALSMKHMLEIGLKSNAKDKKSEKNMTTSENDEDFNSGISFKL